MDDSRRKLHDECRKRLMKAKQDRLNGIRALDVSLKTEIMGDEGDMAKSLTDQATDLAQRDRMLMEIREIDEALGRLDEGTYGNCEETEEPIEEQRLLAIPWTRTSIVGAQMRESRKKRFA